MKLIVNGIYIYALKKGTPVMVSVPTNPSRIVVSDGFHITPAFKIMYSQKTIQYIHVHCIIEDDQLIAGLVIMILLYAMGLTSGILVLQILSVVPIGYFLYLYYFNRKKFIRLRPV